jgi:orotidine-5'-phosphate decarboxylase
MLGSMHPEIIIALDVANQHELSATLARLPDEISCYKIGLELFCAEGPTVLKPLQNKDKNIFLDLKLHDIPRTVEKAVASVIQHRVQLLTIHASGGKEMMRAAADAAKNSGTKLLAVTVLTSLDAENLSSLGITRSPADQALALAEMAFASGIDGIVCSVHEAARIRAALGPSALIVTPGIRMANDATGDQKRIATPRAAALAGATHLVVGRPILAAPHPAKAYRDILASIRAIA